jgi:hypothetical protein
LLKIALRLHVDSNNAMLRLCNIAHSIDIPCAQSGGYR